jgi:glycine oxidase
VEQLSGAAARSLSGIIHQETREAYYEPRLLQVRPPRLLRALLASVARRGGVVRGHDPVLDIVVERERVIGVRTSTGIIHSDEVVLAAGASAGDLARRTLGVTIPVRPIRGQIVLLETSSPREGPLLLGTDGRYLIPRADGRILAGSTFEDVGFDCNVTARGVQHILAGALRLAPSLAGARVAATWAGLRPQSPDRLPYLGRVPGLGGLVVAAGHFRDGILLTPVTAEVVSDVIAGRTATIDLSPFAPQRSLPDWQD